MCGRAAADQPAFEAERERKERQRSRPDVWRCAADQPAFEAERERPVLTVAAKTVGDVDTRRGGDDRGDRDHDHEDPPDEPDADREGEARHE
ncbi:MAG: hypothetical protein QOE62_308 [Actinomycetota bacterium]|nr:hypothetical protein [Actinomycetota bacterium]